MSKIFVFLTFLTFFKALQSFPNHKIIGGTDTNIKNHPHQISLQFNNKHVCGGSIISEKWVLTSALCVYAKNISDFQIVAGVSDLTNQGQAIKITNVYNHPNFSQLTFDCDMALLELSESLVFNENIQAISLPELGTEPKEGSDVVCTGWGANSTGSVGDLSNTLQEVTVQILNWDSCNDIFLGRITRNMICAGVVDGSKDNCNGDDGGPLVANGKLVGIVAWGWGCSPFNYFGVYSNVGVLRSFIHDVTGI